MTAKKRFDYILLIIFKQQCFFRCVIIQFIYENFRSRSPDVKTSVMNSSSNKLTPVPQEDLSNVGFGEEPDLVDLCDMSGHIWVHERCAAWTLASIATKSSADFSVDLTNQILSKVRLIFMLFGFGVLLIPVQVLIRFLLKACSENSQHIKTISCNVYCDTVMLICYITSYFKYAGIISGVPKFCMCSV